MITYKNNRFGLPRTASQSSDQCPFGKGRGAVTPPPPLPLLLLSSQLGLRKTLRAYTQDDEGKSRKAQHAIAKARLFNPLPSKSSIWKILFHFFFIFWIVLGIFYNIEFNFLTISKMSSCVSLFFVEDHKLI